MLVVSCYPGLGLLDLPPAPAATEMSIGFIMALCALPFVCSFSEVPLLGGFFIERHVANEKVYECLWVTEPTLIYHVRPGRCSTVPGP